MKQEMQIIGYDNSALGDKIFYSYNPVKQTNNDFSFLKATQEEVNQAVMKASAASQVYRKKSGSEKATFLEAIAEGILSTGEELISICSSETALPPAR